MSDAPQPYDSPPPLNPGQYQQPESKPPEPETTFAAKQLKPLFLIIQVLLGLLVALMALVGFATLGDKDENPLIFFGVALSILALMGGIHAFKRWFLNRETERMAVSMQHIADNPDKVEWTDKRKLFGRVLPVVMLSVAAACFLIAIELGIFVLAFILFIFVLVWAIEGGEPAHFQLTNDGIVIKTKRGSERRAPAHSLKLVIMGHATVNAGYGIQTQIEQCRVLDDRNKTVLLLKDRFEWPVSAIAEQISEYYQIPFERRG